MCEEDDELTSLNEGVKERSFTPSFPIKRDMFTGVDCTVWRQWLMQTLNAYKNVFFREKSVIVS